MANQRRERGEIEEWIRERRGNEREREEGTRESERRLLLYLERTEINVNRRRDLDVRAGSHEPRSTVLVTVSRGRPTNDRGRTFCDI